MLLFGNTIATMVNKTAGVSIPVKTMSLSYLTVSQFAITIYYARIKDSEYAYTMDTYQAEEFFVTSEDFIEQSE